MTAAQIAKIVGNKPKWFEQMEYDGHHWTYWFSERQGVGVPDDVAELAFVGAAVRELARRQLIVRVHDCSRRGGQCRVVCWHAITEDTVGTFDGETALAALNAALNESEAT